MKSTCAICENEIDVEMCCSGHECGCMGQPTEPPVCSKECYDKFMEYRNKVKASPVQLPKLRIFGAKDDKQFWADKPEQCKRCSSTETWLCDGIKYCEYCNIPIN